MTAAKVRAERWDVETRLSQLDFVREELIEVIRACVAQHAQCTDNDPPGAKGYEVYRWGVRKLRETKAPHGWVKSDRNGYSTVVNHDLRIRVAVINSDEKTGDPDPTAVPQNRTRKGVKSAEVAAENESVGQMSLGGDDWAAIPEQARRELMTGYGTWHLCIYISGDDVRAELSMLHGFEDGYFTEAFERVILLGFGDWEKYDFKDNPEEGPDLTVKVTRK